MELTDPRQRELSEAVFGCLLGAAVGDALGLPMEGLSRRRRARMFPDVTGYHFLFGRGLVSDDAEHQALTAQALAAGGGLPDRFAKSLAWRLRFWFLGLPAGIGLATLRASVKLWLGFPPSKSGVFSAGNGPAMRAAVIGAAFRHDPERIKALVRVCTRITHTDPKAEYGSLAVALAARRASLGLFDPEGFLTELEQALGDPGGECLDLARRAAVSVTAGETAETFADSLGLRKGVTGYVYHTVPVVLWAWFRHPQDMAGALAEVIRLGGDTDTAASILGGMVGAGSGPAGIPDHLKNGLADWPFTVAWLERLADTLVRVAASGVPARPPGLFFPAKLVRNLFFMIVVLLHGFRRLLPPY